MGSVEAGLKRSWSPCRFQRRQSDCPHSVHAPRIMHCACSLFFLHGAHMEHLSCVLALISLHTHAHTCLYLSRLYDETRSSTPSCGACSCMRAQSPTCALALAHALKLWYKRCVCSHLYACSLPSFCVARALSRTRFQHSTRHVLQWTASKTSNSFPHTCGGRCKLSASLLQAAQC
jgi:hypothetical protein